MKTSFLLEEKVRSGVEPDNPEILLSLLSLLEETDFRYSLSHQKSLNSKMLRLLLDTVLDKTVPLNWRSLCMDHIYKPLRNLYLLAENERDIFEINKIYFRLSRVVDNNW